MALPFESLLPGTSGAKPKMQINTPKSVSRGTSPPPLLTPTSHRLTPYLTYDSTSPRALLKVSPRIVARHSRIRSTPQNVLKGFYPTSPSAASLSKGLKLLYNLYPQKVLDEVGLPVPSPRGSKLEQSILAPVRNYLRRRSSVRQCENTDVMTRIRQIFSQNTEPTSPSKQISDVERLCQESDKRLRHNCYSRKSAASSVACSPTPTIERTTSPTPLLLEEAELKSHPTINLQAKTAKQNQAVQSQMMVVNLPALPFSQHKSYNEEKDFIRKHLFEVAVESTAGEELERLMHHTKLSRRSLNQARKATRLLSNK